MAKPAIENSVKPYKISGDGGQQKPDPPNRFALNLLRASRPCRDGYRRVLATLAQLELIQGSRLLAVSSPIHNDSLLSTAAGARDLEIGVIGALGGNPVIACGILPNCLQDG